MFYRVANLPIEKVCIIKNFEEANFSDFKGLLTFFGGCVAKEVIVK